MGRAVAREVNHSGIVFMTSFKGGYLKTVGKGWGEVRYKVSVDTVVLDLKHYLPTWAPMGLQRKAKDPGNLLLLTTSVRRSRLLPPPQQRSLAMQP